MASIARPDSTLPFRTGAGGSFRVSERSAVGKASETILTGRGPEDTVSLSEGASTVVDPLVYNLQQFAETAKDAANEIATLRSKQTELAYKAAEETVDGRTFGNLQEEYDAIDSEVARVQQVASYNDTQVLTARTLRVSLTSSDLNTTISVADPTAITTDRGYSIGSIATASTAYEQTQELGFVTNGYSDDRAIASSKTKQLTDLFVGDNPTDVADSSQSERSQAIFKKADEVRSQISERGESDGRNNLAAVGATLDEEA